MEGQTFRSCHPSGSHYTCSPTVFWNFGPYLIVQTVCLLAQPLTTSGMAKQCARRNHSFEMSVHTQPSSYIYVTKRDGTRVREQVQGFHVPSFHRLVSPRNVAPNRCLSICISFSERSRVLEDIAVRRTMKARKLLYCDSVIRMHKSIVTDLK